MMNVNGLNHPGIDLVDQLRTASTEAADVIRIKLENDIFSLKSRIEGQCPATRLPGDVMELHILEVALAYSAIEDFGDADSLRSLKNAKAGLAPDGKTPLASQLLRRQLALANKPACKL